MFCIRESVPESSIQQDDKPTQEYVFSSVKYFLESVIWAYSIFMYVQVWSKFNLENFISLIEGNINFVTI